VDWLNYHHLRYFWTAVREGGVSRAAAALRVAQPTVSAQLRELEASLGQRLIDRDGGRFELTDAGRTAYHFAQQIFTLGGEMQRALSRVEDEARLRIGVADVLPKLLAARLLAPVWLEGASRRMSCIEEPTPELVRRLKAGELDLALSDVGPQAEHAEIGLAARMLVESEVVVMGSPGLAQRCRRRFPESLDQVNWLAPLPHTAMRRSLQGWFASRGVTPRIIGEFDSTALLKAFSQHVPCVFAIAAVTEADVRRRYNVRRVGVVRGLHERVFALSTPHRIDDPVIAAILASSPGSGDDV